MSGLPKIERCRRWRHSKQIQPKGMRNYLKGQILQTAPMASQPTRSYSVRDTPSQARSTTNTQSTSVWEEETEDLGEGTSGGNRQRIEEHEAYDYQYDDEEEEDEEEEVIRPKRKRARTDPFQHMWRELDEQDARVSEESPSEAELYVTKRDPSPPPTKSSKGKGRAMATKVKPKPRAKQTNPRKPSPKKQAKGRGKSPATKEKQQNLHIFFDN